MGNPALETPDSGVLSSLFHLQQHRRLHSKWSLMAGGNQNQTLSLPFQTTFHLAPTCLSSCPHCLSANHTYLCLVPKLSSLHLHLPPSLLPSHPLIWRLSRRLFRPIVAFPSSNSSKIHLLENCCSMERVLKNRQNWIQILPLSCLTLGKSHDLFLPQFSSPAKLQ